eukprot:EG_transcript_28478
MVDAAAGLLGPPAPGTEDPPPTRPHPIYLLKLLQGRHQELWQACVEVLAELQMATDLEPAATLVQLLEAWALQKEKDLAAFNPGGDQLQKARRSSPEAQQGTVCDDERRSEKEVEVSASAKHEFDRLRAEVVQLRAALAAMAPGHPQPDLPLPPRWLGPTAGDPDGVPGRPGAPMPYSQEMADLRRRDRGLMASQYA